MILMQHLDASLTDKGDVHVRICICIRVGKNFMLQHIMRVIIMIIDIITISVLAVSQALKL